MRGFQQCSAHLTKCHSCHGFCTLNTTWRSPDNGNSQKTRNMTRLKCCTCQSKYRWRSPKCCACHEDFFWKRHNGTRKTRLQPDVTPSKRIGFAASPIDTARLEENQRLETRHVRASKRACRARLPPIFTLCVSKSMFSHEFSQRTLNSASSKPMFHARLPAIFSTSHKVPLLPWILHIEHHLTQPWQW